MKQKIQKNISEKLYLWFKENKRDMPWRETSDPYKIWISEVMLQQTQVSTVIDYYLRWMEQFPDVQTLAQANQNTILKAWEGLGYYTRARNLHKGAQYIIDSLDGYFPNSYDSLLKVPGIGPYSAAAISSIAFGKAAGVVDGNVKRVLSRLFEFYDNSATQHFTKTCKSLVESGFYDFPPKCMNQAWMELGALVCTPNPKCQSCPINTHCEAFIHNTMSDFPVKTKKVKIPVLKGAIFIIRENNTFLVVQRKSTGLLGGLWEFPNTYYDESPLADFTLGNDILIDSTYLKAAKHQYSHFKVDFEIYESRIRTPWWNDYWQTFKWVSQEELKALPRPKVHIKAMEIAGLI